MLIRDAIRWQQTSSGVAFPHLYGYGIEGEMVESFKEVRKPTDGEKATAWADALFGRILNGLSGWGNGVWDSSLGGIVNWDGCQTGYSIIRQEDGSSLVQWEYEAAIAGASSNTAKGIMGERKDESMSGFLDGVRSIFSLGEDDDKAHPEELPTRFIVLLNAEKLSTLETIAPGQSEGTLLACIMRLAELVGLMSRSVKENHNELNSVFRRHAIPLCRFWRRLPIGCFCDHRRERRNLPLCWKCLL
jgi:hypothetical protein